MSPGKLAIVGIALVAGLAWLVGIDVIYIAGAAIVVGLIMFLNARDWHAFGTDPWDLPARAPKVDTRDLDSIDLGDELEDLLRSAAFTAGRLIESKGRLDPFVMYEDAAGNVRTRRVDETDPERILPKARELARAVDESAPRVILAAPGFAGIDGKAMRVVIYEAAERRFRERTLAFVQPYQRRHLIFPAELKGVPMFVGDAPHSLRFGRLPSVHASDDVTHNAPTRAPDVSSAD